jgi:pSer/pThr/pTyr-binding forkhead associated (FHA) protein
MPTTSPVNMPKAPIGQWLVLREARFWERGRVLEFPSGVHQATLGRSSSCSWRINDPSVSRLHAALVRRPHRGVYLMDLASREGTFVNGERVTGEWLLMNGDRISLGSDVVLEYNEGRPPAAAPRRRWLKPLGWLGAGMFALVASLLARS